MPESSAELAAVLDSLNNAASCQLLRMVEQVMHVRKSKFGSRRIVHELREKGIPENLIAAALPNIKETEHDSGAGSVAEKVRRHACRMQRIWQTNAVLMNRGFAAEVISMSCIMRTRK